MKISKIEKEYLKKIKLFQKYNKYYHDKSNPQVTDSEFDYLKEEIIELSFKGISISENIAKLKDLNLVLIGNGSKIFNRNSFQIEDKYNYGKLTEE